jgi:hypothetical protein
MNGVELPALQEDLTYDQMYRMSEPKRFQRSHHVHMPPLEIEQYQTDHHWVFAHYFNAKSDPGHSTTGLRHRGFIRFKKPKRKGHDTTPLSQLPVEVDCMCPDYRYRWAWANHQKRAGPIGPNSLNQCINRAPRHTNPLGKPGFCKHILATRDYIYGLLSSFPDNVGPSERLDRLTKRATKRWLNFGVEMDAARERDARIAAAKARRNIGLPPDQQAKAPGEVNPVEPPPLPAETPAAPAAPEPVQPVQPAAGPVPPAPPQGPAPLGQEIKGTKPGQFLARRFLKTESVGSMMSFMKTLTLQEAKPAKDALRLLEELGDEYEDSPLSDRGGEDGFPPAEGSEMPMEPPVSDSAIGASTEDNVALGLLREIRDLLATLVGEEGGEEGEPPELPEEGEEVEPGEGEEEKERLGSAEEFKPGKRPMPVPNGAGGE